MAKTPGVLIVTVHGKGGFRKSFIFAGRILVGSLRGLEPIMKSIQKRTILALLSVVLAACMVLPSAGAALSSPSAVSHRAPLKKTSSTGQYWGLIFAVGTYYNHPDEDRPEMIDAANNLFTTLTNSPNWQADHIHMLTASMATGKNLINELIWLSKNSQPGDYVVIYLTTHGGQLRNSKGLPWDLPPKDESDGMDEFLVMYNGFETWYSIVWDDLLNFFLSRIKCQGLCLIVDSCYSGGFNDDPMQTGTKAAMQAYVTDFVQSVSGQNRIVLMSCRENEVSYGTDFSNYLISGFQGWADFFGNGDGINSAEESFAFADFWVELGGQQVPTISDNFPGEFPVTFN